MKKLTEYFSNTFLVGIIAIVAIVALVLYGNGTPAGALGVNEIQAPFWQEPCSDNDPKNLPDYPGTVHYGMIQYVDWCVDDKQLGGQYWCEGAKNVKHISANGLICENGCLNGACQ